MRKRHFCGNAFTRGCARAFTLVELLVVIGIIAVLIGMLLPALSSARFQVQFTVCAEHQRQWVLAMHNYAADSKGYFPRYDMPLAGAGNASDMSAEYYNIMTQRYHFQYASFFCPMATQDHLDAASMFTGPPNGLFLAGYLYWVPRRHDVGTFPPSGVWNPPMTNPSLPHTLGDPLPFHGPGRLGDKVANTNPVISEWLYTSHASAPVPTTDLSRDGTMLYYATHTRHGKLVGYNAGFADGHVERLLGAEAKPRYWWGSTWNWR